MKSSVRLAALVGLLMSFGAAQAQAEDIKVFSSTALRGVLHELVPQFEKQSGNKIVLTIGPAAVMKAQLDQGAAFDVAILTPPLLDGLAIAGKIDSDSRVTVAKSGLAVSVRPGTDKPDVSSADALKRTLLAAKSIGLNGQGATRAGAEAMFAKLGIADEVKPKIKWLTTTAPEGITKGEVELGLSPASEALEATGTQVAGLVPADYQSYIVLVGGVSTGARNAEAAKALLQFLTAPSASPVLKQKGMEPG
ncbi:MAG: molybdate ABC transporter substrate-binding protein [Alphaproteobacteria bacterium]|nr:molybdate ABC transporter substrate-binding protein [Alphaproteobacteria bacterium]